LIKLDVDGMELDLLRDALATIHRTRPILYVESDREAKSDDLRHFIAALGTDLFWLRPLSAFLEDRRVLEALRKAPGAHATSAPSAHTVPRTEKRTLGHISIPHQEFRWAPE
jgi:hypothetical protein